MRTLSLALLLIATPLAASADTWSLSTIDPASNSGWSPSLVLDAEFHPHVAYWFPEVSYAYHDGTTWHHEPIRPPYAAGLASLESRGVQPARSQLIRTYETHLALAPDGTPWIAYAFHDCDHGCSGSLQVSHKQGGTWTVETIDPNDYGADLACDGSGKLWLTYDSSTQGPRLATRGAGGWTSEPLPAYTPCLALDRNGTPWISYNGGSPNGLWIARRDGPGIWTGMRVDTVANAPRVAFDASNRPRVAYNRVEPDVSIYRLRYAEWNGVDWIRTLVPEGGDKAAVNSLALDPAGEPWISYVDYVAGNAYGAHRSNGRWQIDAVDTTGYAGQYSSIAVDPFGRAWMAYKADISAGFRMARTAQSTGIGDLPPIPGDLRLSVVGTNPLRAGSAASLRISTPTAGPARIEAFDLSGRRVAPTRSWSVVAGTTELPWTTPVAHGLCLVRATIGGRSTVARVMVVR